MDKDEQLVMVVNKNLLLGECFQGFKSHGREDYESVILRNAEYIKRGLAEKSPEYKQPIPYCIILNPSTGKIYAYKRAVEDSKYHEKRLQGKWSWGVGGHVEKYEEKSENPIKDALLRELQEEIDIGGEIKNIRVLGYINDDKDDVGIVHFGILYIVETDATEIKLRDKEIEKGEFKTIGELREICSSPEFVVENWSQISLEALEFFLQNKTF